MIIQAWMRLLGLMIILATLPDIMDTLRSIKDKYTRNRVLFVIVMLALLNLLMFFSLVYISAFCPIFSSFIAATTCAARVLIGYLYCIRVELALRLTIKTLTIVRILRLLHAYLFLAFVLNVGKAVILYSSEFDENGRCTLYLGEGIWQILDEIMFSLADVLTFAMLLSFYNMHKSTLEIGKKGGLVKQVLGRVLYISIFPMISTIATSIQVMIDPTKTYSGNIDLQIHIICLFFVFAQGRTKQLPKLKDRTYPVLNGSRPSLPNGGIQKTLGSSPSTKFSSSQ